MILHLLKDIEVKYIGDEDYDLDTDGIEEIAKLIWIWLPAGPFNKFCRMAAEEANLEVSVVKDAMLALAKKVSSEGLPIAESFDPKDYINMGIYNGVRKLGLGDVKGLNNVELLDVAIEKFRMIKRHSMTMDPCSVGPFTCSLCDIYVTPTGSSCVGCPIRMHTNKPGCKGTPFYEVRSAINLLQDGLITIKGFSLVCDKEIDFLKMIKEIESGKTDSS